MKIKILLLPILILILTAQQVFPQIAIGSDESIDYNNPKEYSIGGVTVTGVQYLDPSVLVMVSGLQVGQSVKIPGEQITAAIEKLWKQGLFENVRIVASRFEDKVVFLEIQLTERPRLSKFSFSGVKKSEADDLREQIRLVSGDVVTDNLIIRTKNQIKKHFNEKGFLNTEVAIDQQRDTTKLNNVALKITVKKNNKIRIGSINFHGNEALASRKLKGAMEETRERTVFHPLRNLDKLVYNTARNFVRMDMNGITDYAADWYADNVKIRIFKSSKFIRSSYTDDKKKIIEAYNSKGYRDAYIERDSVYRNDDRSVNVDLWVNEGRKYYYRNVTWVGNTKYTADFLNSVLRIRKGDVYNQELLETNLSYNPNGFDVSSLYLDEGYLFFSAQPVEVKVENDSIDLEIRIYEGKQARINKVSVMGNDRTNDHVIIRELRTRPGQLFSRSEIIRTQRELAQLRYFNPEKLGIDYTPNPQDGTVDLEYKVEETSADQVELSGGWGYGRIVGTLGFSFNNFSAKRLFKKGAWKPIPSGDGQKLSLRFQTYGSGYISASASFTEPWLGGKKPNAFTTSFYYSRYTNGLSSDDASFASFVIHGLGFSLGRRLEWPDDFFTLYQSVNLQRYSLKNYSSIFSFGNGNGIFNNLSYTIALGRRSDDNPIFPRKGSDINLSLEVTPPYSLFSGKDYKNLDENSKYEWIEYHKWKLYGSWYNQIVGDLVLATKTKFGFLGMYNSDIGITPFERFYMGGDGLSGYNNLDGREIIALRGYSNESILPEYFNSNTVGGTIFAKYTLELRFPLSLNPNATIYALGFMEGGNTWSKFSKFNPFSIYKAAGLGMRIYLPMFGILGLDYGYGLDEIPGNPNANGGQFHFSINQSID
ncbi:MAG: POTRA domain-containing protein [Bacteroidales bacterium]|nr:POTRA domain-containing protein [Bacteroidales bacterium]MDD3666495.1 POTRA domain-containing protein [Bacteroidales bacterium]